MADYGQVEAAISNLHDAEPLHAQHLALPFQQRALQASRIELLMPALLQLAPWRLLHSLMYRAASTRRTPDLADRGR